MREPDLEPGSTAALPGHRALDGPRVALVHDWLTGMRGGEKCLEQFCTLFPNAHLYTLIHRPGSVSPSIQRMRIKTSPLQQFPGVFRHYRKLLPIMPWAARRWAIGDVDLVISLSHCVAKSVRVPRGVPHFCYCFTPMRYAWDGRDAYLDSMPPGSLQRNLAATLLDHLRDWDRRTAASVTHYIAISNTVKERISRCYGRESRVIEPPVDVAYFRPDPATRRAEFYLCVSALVPYKRVDHAVAACAKLDRPLIVIGKGPERARLERIAGPSTRFLGWQPDEVVRNHYQRCRALLFPGEEDFGIVPAEALACGAPVIALGRGGAAETVDPEVGRLYEHPTIDALADAILEFEHSPPPDPALARRRAENLAPEFFRSRILSFLKEHQGHSLPPRAHFEHLTIRARVTE
jgi:glycosyltransferase involved in cell wall biosynthesis